MRDTLSESQGCNGIEEQNAARSGTMSEMREVCTIVGSLGLQPRLSPGLQVLRATYADTREDKSA